MASTTNNSGHKSPISANNHDTYAILRFTRGQLRFFEWQLRVTKEKIRENLGNEDVLDDLYDDEYFWRRSIEHFSGQEGYWKGQLV